MSTSARAAERDITLVLPPLAHWTDRALAGVIDALVLITPAAIGIILAAGVSPVSTAGAHSVVVIGVLASIALSVLWWAREGSTGQSLGKQVLGVVVISQTAGTPIGAKAGLRRGLWRLGLDLLPLGSGVLRQRRDTRWGQSRADARTGTVVVYTRTTTSAAPAAATPAAGSAAATDGPQERAQ